jgi:hypothetical protein
MAQQPSVDITLPVRNSGVYVFQKVGHKPSFMASITFDGDKQIVVIWHKHESGKYISREIVFHNGYVAHFVYDGGAIVALIGPNKVHEVLHFDDIGYMRCYLVELPSDGTDDPDVTGWRALKPEMPFNTLGMSVIQRMNKNDKMFTGIVEECTGVNKKHNARIAPGALHWVEEAVTARKLYLNKIRPDATDIPSINEYLDYLGTFLWLESEVELYSWIVPGLEYSRLTPKPKPASN